MNPLSVLPPTMFDILRRMGRTGVTAREMGVEGSVMMSLVNRGFLLADKEGSPTIYRLSAMGEGAHAILTAPMIPRDCEGSIARIQRVVAEYYGIPQIEMVSSRRSRVVARPRQVAMYLARLLTTHSMPTIGHYFGGRDHTTVIHACRQIEKLQARKDIADQVADLLALLVPDEGEVRAIHHPSPWKTKSSQNLQMVAA